MTGLTNALMTAAAWTATAGLLLFGLGAGLLGLWLFICFVCAVIEGKSLNELREARDD